MPIVTLSKIEKTFGRRVIFDKLDFIIDRGERVGLIGDNGSGKTTLFKTLMGQLPPDAGGVAIAKTVKVGYLSQDPVFDETNSVIDEAEPATTWTACLKNTRTCSTNSISEAGMPGGTGSKPRFWASGFWRIRGNKTSKRFPAGKDRGWRWPRC